ncbi:MAG TPA: dienelactone hydrolase family protein [Verrucomicrobiae bacterium]|nr:dienelactone hydrolase family protein [Verrucomicrobiae bacterium]
MHDTIKETPMRSWTALRIRAIALTIALPLTTIAADDPVKQRLETSPRHNEWVKVKSGERTVQVFVAYPQAKEKATTVLVIHENRGLTDWVRSLADQLAEAGYVAVAPDLLSGAGPGGGKTSDFPSQDAAVQAIYKLAADQVTADLDAVADYAVKLPASNGRLAVAGYCWGGGQSFRFATHRGDLKGAFVFYGPPPEKPEDLAKIGCPVYGFYGGNDGRIGATVAGTTDAMKAAGKTYEPVTYEGAGHGFMRLGEDGTGTDADRKGRDAAWERWREILKGI